MRCVYRVAVFCLVVGGMALRAESGTLTRTLNLFFDERAVSLLTVSVAEPQMLINTAHTDARSILNEENSCSRFFGGSKDALFVLDQLARRMQAERVAIPQVGIRMTGHVREVINMQTGLNYRLFEKVVVNVNGPFYRESCHRGFFANCGGFAPNTREIRVMMLLHELAHMMKGADGKWLIPDDGNDWDLSARNTVRIGKRCGELIRELEK